MSPSTVFCANLCSEVDENLLYELFLQAGPVDSVCMPKDSTGKNRQFAFVNFKHQASVAYSISLFHGLKLYGRQLYLNTKNGTKNNSGGNGSSGDDHNQHQHNNTPAQSNNNHRPLKNIRQFACPLPGRNGGQHTSTTKTIQWQGHRQQSMNTYNKSSYNNMRHATAVGPTPRHYSHADNYEYPRPSSTRNQKHAHSNNNNNNNYARHNRTR